MADLVRLAMLAVTAAGTAAITGLLRQRMMDAFAWERRHHATAARLSAALDQVDIGIVLLDSDTRAEFINRAFRDYFSLPDEKADSKPPFIALMYHGRDTGAFELPEEELSAFIAQRTEMMRSGNSTPINIKLADGQGAALQLHGVARRRTNAELHAGDRPRPPHRRPRQGRLLPLAAQRRRSPPRAGTCAPRNRRRHVDPPNEIDPLRTAPLMKRTVTGLARPRRAPSMNAESPMSSELSDPLCDPAGLRPMASVVGRIQRVLRAVGRDRAFPRDYGDDVGALLRCL